MYFVLQINKPRSTKKSYRYIHICLVCISLLADSGGGHAAFLFTEPPALKWDLTLAKMAWRCL